MKLNRKWLLLVALVLSVAMATTGTLAYLTDDDADVNTMTLGKVEIVQNEQQRVENEAGDDFTDVLEPFDDNKILLPVTGRLDADNKKDTVTIGDNEVTLSDKYNNYVDKIVSATNTGSVDAYVRTLVALPTGGAAWESTPVAANDCWLHWNYPALLNPEWSKNWKILNGATSSGFIEIDGKGYYVWEFVHETVLEPGETTLPAISGIFMDERVDYDVDEEYYYLTYADGTTKKIEDITPTDTVKVYCLTQAVQADGFTDATTALDAGFGDVNATNAAKWFKGLTSEDVGSPGDKNDTNNPPEFAPANGDDPSVTFEAPEDAYEVSTSEQLAQAVAEGKTVIKLADGEYNVANCGGKELSLYGSKKAVLKLGNEGEDGCDYGFGAAGTGLGKVTFNGITIDTTANTGNYKGYAYMGATFNDCTFVGSYSLNNKNTFVFNYCDFDFKDGYLWTWAAEKATFNNCDFNGNSKCILAHGGESTQITINNCKFAATEKGYTGAGDNTACVEMDPTGTNTYTIDFTGYNTKTDNYSGWTRVKDDSTGHVISGLE